MHPIRSYFIAILMLLGIGVIGQNQIVEQLLTSKDLPFREVIASFEDDDNIIWMVLPSSICRNTGSDIECFDYALQGAESAFIVDQRYIVVHNLIRSTLGYFDIKKRTWTQLNVDDSKKLVLDISTSPQLYFTDYSHLYKFDFTKQKSIKCPLGNHFKNVMPSRCFTDGESQSFQVTKDKTYCNGSVVDIPNNINVEYYQIAKWKNTTIINNGRDIYSWNEKTKTHSPLYSDDRLCKKMYFDTKGNIVINVPKALICRYSEQLLLTDITFKHFTKLNQFHQIAALDSTLAHVGGRDFKNKTLISSYHGFATLTKNQKLISTLLNSEKNEGFGTIIKGITVDKNGNKYFSNEVRHIYRQKPSGSVDTFNIVIPFRDTLIKYQFSRNIYIDPETGLLWGVCGSYVKTESILFAMNVDTKLIEYSTAISHRTWSFTPRNRQLILSTSRDLIFVFDIEKRSLDTLCILPKKDNPESRVVYHLDSDKTLIGGKGGVYSYNWTSKKLDRMKDLDSAQVYSLAHIKNHLFVGTLDGVWVYDMTSQKVLKKYNKKHGLSDNFITAISPLPDEKLLVATFKGINLIDSKKNLITNFYEEHGISNNEFNFIAHFYTDSIDYFGSINGVTSVNKSLLQSSSNNITKISKSITYSFKAAPITTFNSTQLVFGPDDQKIVVYLHNDSCHYQARFAYRLVGDGLDFQNINGNTLEILRPSDSNQEIEFICTNNLGLWSEKTTKFKIITQKHFYNNGWFYGLLSMLFGLLIYLLSLWRINVIKKNEAAITEVNKKMAEQKLIALQSQMNPHFLFNTMSSLQYLIQTKNTEQADNLLTSFGVLMRMILESSKTKFWSLREEIKMIKLYCELEKQRFDDGNLDIIINDADIFSYDTEIPPMIIQPFIENVFNHAFVGMKEKATLSISFDEDAGILTVKIQDNGIGIQKSQELKSNFQLIKKSRGLEITKERIENYNHENHGSIRYTIEPTNPTKTNPGTTVTIRIQVGK